MFGSRCGNRSDVVELIRAEKDKAGDGRRLDVNNPHLFMPPIWA
jgi:hypothetical protein